MKFIIELTTNSLQTKPAAHTGERAGWVAILKQSRRPDQVLPSARSNYQLLVSCCAAIQNIRFSSFLQFGCCTKCSWRPFACVRVVAAFLEDLPAQTV